MSIFEQVEINRYILYYNIRLLGREVSFMFKVHLDFYIMYYHTVH